MMLRRWASGFSLLEVVITVALLGLLVTLAFTRWQGYMAHQRLRYGTAQVATDLRSAQERARSERTPYTVSFTSGVSTYSIAGGSGGFQENTQLPDGVTAVASVTVTFSAFGKLGASQTVTVQNSAGTRTITANPAGGITYQEP
jgi:prepilin-type N-terminal cleavage/methylation domain-containing protein